MGTGVQTTKREDPLLGPREGQRAEPESWAGWRASAALTSCQGRVPPDEAGGF